MPFRCHAVAAAAGALLFPALSARASAANADSIVHELPATSALCVICANVSHLDQRVGRLERRITGQQPQFDEFSALKMVFGPYWKLSAPMAWVLPSPAKGNILELRKSLVILQTTNSAKFTASLKNGPARGGITPAQIEGSPAFIATRGAWTFISASRSTLKIYMQAKSRLALPGDMMAAVRHADIAVEGDTRAIKKELFEPSQALLGAMPVNHQWVGSPALNAILHQMENKLTGQLNTAIRRSVLTLHLGRRAVIINLTAAFHARTPIGRLFAAQNPLAANALAGLPNLRYFALYADSINGTAVAKWLRTLLPANVHSGPADPVQKPSKANIEIQNILTAIANHTGTAAIMPAPATPAGAADLVNPWDAGPDMILMHTSHPKTEIGALADCLSRATATRIKHGSTAGTADHKASAHSNIMGYPAISINLATQKHVRTPHVVQLVNIGPHRVLVGVDVSRKLLKSAVAAAGSNLMAIMKRPGLAQTITEVVPRSFMVAYLPIARWSQQRTAVPAPKPAHALMLGLPPPPAVFSVGAGGKSLNMQLYIPVASLEQSLSGNPVGALF